KETTKIQKLVTYVSDDPVVSRECRPCPNNLFHMCIVQQPLNSQSQCHRVPL
ncbi:unnamed protein product, partial [Allacma fusca]